MHRFTVVLVALVLAVAAFPAGAEHKVYYRYVVLGFVKDTNGKLAPGREVSVVRDKTGLAYPAVTDHQGLFVVVVRLGDESDGETLTVQIGKATTRITARFDSSNHVEERGTRLDLDGSKFVERPAAFRPTLVRFIGTGTH